MTTNCSTLAELVACCGGEVRTGPFGSQLHKHDYVESEGATPVVMPKDMIEGCVDTSSIARIDDDTVERLKQHVLRPGDIVLARRGDIGRRAWIGDREAGWLCGTGSMRISLRECPRVRARYLYYYLATERAVGWLEGHSVGSTMSNLSAGVVEQLPVEFPPIDVQDEVVRILDSIESLVDNNRQRTELLEEAARSIYREWFVSFRIPGHASSELVNDAGPMPAHWQLRSVGAVAELVRGRSYRKTELVEQGGVPFLNLKCIDRGGGFRKSGLKRYQGKFTDPQRTCPGDTVIAVTDMTQERRIVAQAGRVPTLPEGFGVISLDLVRVLPSDDVEADYLYSVFRYSDFADVVKEHANGTNVLHLNPDRIREFLVAVPNSTTQQQYAAVVRPMFDLVDKLQLQNEALGHIRDRLLPRLVAGQWDLSDLDTALAPVG